MDYMKFEIKDRIDEIDIVNSLKLIDFGGAKNLCDYGAGTGILALEAAKMTSGLVYALDMSQDMLDLVDEKIAKNKIANIISKKVQADVINLDDNSVDVFMMITVFHHIGNIPTFISEIKRVLTKDGKILIVEFIKDDTKMGPPKSHRMAPNEVSKYFELNGIQVENQKILGENMYLITFSV